MGEHVAIATEASEYQMDGMKKSLGTILSCRVHHSSGAHIMRLKPCNPLAARQTMESRMPGNSHVRFGERDGETDLSNEARHTISTLRLRVLSFVKGCIVENEHRARQQFW